MVKFTVWERFGVADMPPMMTSNLPAISAGMMPSQAVEICSTSQPLSAASLRATSISKPMNSPLLLRMAHGTNVEKPTFSTLRFLMSSSVLDAARSFCASACEPTRAESAMAAMVINRFRFFIIVSG